MIPMDFPYFQIMVLECALRWSTRKHITSSQLRDKWEVGLASLIFDFLRYNTKVLRLQDDDYSADDDGSRVQGNYMHEGTWNSKNVICMSEPS